MNTHRARYSLYHLQSTHSRWRCMWDFLAFRQKLQCCQGHFYLEMCQISSKGLHVNADHIRKMRYILKITIEHTIQNTRSIWIEIFNIKLHSNQIGYFTLLYFAYHNQYRPLLCYFRSYLTVLGSISVVFDRMTRLLNSHQVFNFINFVKSPLKLVLYFM